MQGISQSEDKAGLYVLEKKEKEQLKEKSMQNALRCRAFFYIGGELYYQVQQFTNKKRSSYESLVE